MKSVSYSYPSSPHAAKLGFARSGCFTVLVDGSAVRGFASNADAFTYADTLPGAYDRWTIVRPVALAPIVSTSVRPASDSLLSMFCQAGMGPLLTLLVAVLAVTLAPTASAHGSTSGGLSGVGSHSAYAGRSTHAASHSPRIPRAIGSPSSVLAAPSQYGHTVNLAHVAPHRVRRLPYLATSDHGYSPTMAHDARSLRTFTATASP